MNSADSEVPADPAQRTVGPTPSSRALWVRITVGAIVLFAMGFGVARATESSATKDHATTRRHLNGAALSSVTASAATLRRTLESKLLKAIAADAHLMVRIRRFQGPILGVACTPMERGGTPVVADTLHFNCIAIKRRNGRTLEGARYFATINGDTGSYTYGGD